MVPEGPPSFAQLVISAHDCIIVQIGSQGSGGRGWFWDIILLCIIAISTPCMRFPAKIENPVLRCVPKSLAEDEPHTGGAKTHV